MAPSADIAIEPIAPIEPPAPLAPLHALPPPFTDSNLEVLTQGAEALVYKTTFLTPATPCVVKYRPPKPYRHPTLDKRLTKTRLLAEARVLVRCRKEGVGVPGVLAGDWDNGWLVLEWIEGMTVRKVLDEWADKVKRGDKKEGDDEMLGVMRKVGRAVGRLHDIGVCHGDLTTSNLMLRQPSSSTEHASPLFQHRGHQTVSAMREAAMDGADGSEPSPPQPQSELDGDIILIDFGLVSQTIQDEDRAVDLYVLERAFSATHPAAEPLFQKILTSYGESFKGAKTVLRRLEDVRLRGRKRSMLG
ncbi:BUD32 protein kinase [Massariosphaeria phaeospora]|uniref:EKC/KEOPS complex subunit BUD32 n=1 Tax=Massariosphaeria phaeospora TaxID=100035 RepID=A0A7C8I0S7_9PLEO|nr:BUD32 protein kinase [Massariosphaeria phaeospora]